MLTRRESVDEPPDYHSRDLRTGELLPLTDFPHPTPQLRGLQKELIRYQRADGVKLTATLVWAYPQEFKSADAAGQAIRCTASTGSASPRRCCSWRWATR